MLFHPAADERLGAIGAQLDLWDGEADRFRSAAIAARAGEAPSTAQVAAAEETHDGLTSLIDELDRALETMPPGAAHFPALLRAQTRAVALIESIGSSLDVLAECPAVAVPEPILAGHPAMLRIAR
jgi:hypothetical protein